MKKDSRRSGCWNFFEKVEGGAKCFECDKVIACFGNTSNLVKHLRRVHKKTLNSGESPRIQSIQPKRKRKKSSDSEESEGEGTAPSDEEPREATVAETNSAVHTIQAYRDVNGTTFLYLHPAPEGETGAQAEGAQFQPVVANSESIAVNGGELVPVQRESSALEGQAVDGDGKTQEVVASPPRKRVNAPVKNYQGSTVANRAIVRQMTRPSPITTVSSTNSSNNNGHKEDTFDAFGKYIASMLRGLPSKTSCKLQGEIVNWILKEHMKNNS